MVLTATAARPDPRPRIGIAKQIALGSGVRSALKAFAPTERFFSLGDPKTNLYVVESGVVAVYEPRLEGHQAIIEFAFPGDIVGMGFLQTHTCTARASVETVAHFVGGLLVLSGTRWGYLLVAAAAVVVVVGALGVGRRSG